MKEWCGLCFIACTIFCAQPDAKEEPATTSQKIRYQMIQDKKKRNVRLSGMPDIIRFAVITSKPPLHPTLNKELVRPSTAPYVPLQSEAPKKMPPLQPLKAFADVATAAQPQKDPK